MELGPQSFSTRTWHSGLRPVFSKPGDTDADDERRLDEQVACQLAHQHSKTTDVGLCDPTTINVTIKALQGCHSNAHTYTTHTDV